MYSDDFVRTLTQHQRLIEQALGPQWTLPIGVESAALEAGRALQGMGLADLCEQLGGLDPAITGLSHLQGALSDAHLSGLLEASTLSATALSHLQDAFSAVHLDRFQDTFSKASVSQMLETSTAVESAVAEAGALGKPLAEMASAWDETRLTDLLNTTSATLQGIESYGAAINSLHEAVNWPDLLGALDNSNTLVGQGAKGVTVAQELLGAQAALEPFVLQLRAVDSIAPALLPFSAVVDAWQQSLSDLDSAVAFQETVGGKLLNTFVELAAEDGAEATKRLAEVVSAAPIHPRASRARWLNRAFHALAFLLALHSSLGQRKSDARLERIERALTEPSGKGLGTHSEPDASALRLTNSFLTVAHVNLRAGPGRTHKILDVIPPNRLVVPLERKGRWLRVEVYDFVTAESREGWLYRRYLRSIREAVE